MRSALVACCLVALFCLVYPLYVIRPFRAQGQEELALALIVRSWAPLASGLAAAATVVLALALWRRGRRRVISAATTLVAVAAAVLTHVNVYERMFHRIDSVEAVPATSAQVDSDDMVIAIRAGGEARAYPVRTMAYHHIANDSPGGNPVVATY